MLIVFIRFSLMAYITGQSAAPSADKKFLDLVITDLISLSYECKRKYPPVKEVHFAALKSIIASFKFL